LKILETNLKKGFVKVIPETFDDLWHLYNIIYRGDEVYAYTTREIKQDEKYARAKRGERVSVFLGVKVEKVFWDRLLGRLRIHGTICQAPDIVPTGAHHTLNITINTPVTIVKEEWPHHHVERLQAATKASEKPIIIIAIDDEGYAVATTTHYGVEVKVEEKTRLPGKLEAEKREAALKEFFHKALESLRQIWNDTVDQSLSFVVVYFSFSFGFSFNWLLCCVMLWGLPGVHRLGHVSSSFYVCCVLEGFHRLHF
jgi:protein pelota